MQALFRKSFVKSSLTNCVSYGRISKLILVKGKGESVWLILIQVK